MSYANYEGQAFEVGRRDPVRRRWVTGVAKSLPPAVFLRSPRLASMAECPNVRAILEQAGVAFQEEAPAEAPA